MTRARLFLASFLLAAAAVVWIAAAPAALPQAPAFATDVQVEPSGKPQGGFSIRVKVTNLSSGAVVAAPHLLVPAGETSETLSDLPDQSALAVSAKVDATGHAATYSISLKKGEKVLSSHTARVNLP